MFSPDENQPCKGKSPKNKNGHKAHSNDYCIHHTGLYGGGKARKQQIQKSPKKGLLDLNSPYKKANSILLVLARAGKSLYLYLFLVKKI
jgi:hypothetical protein